MHRSCNSHSGHQHGPYPFRPAHAHPSQALETYRPKKAASSVKQNQSFWAHVRFTNSTGQTHAIGQLGQAGNVSFDLKLIFALAPVNGSLILRAIVHDSSAPKHTAFPTYQAIYPMHPTPNMINSNNPAGFTNLIMLDRDSDADFPPPPESINEPLKASHYLRWSTTSALTSGWNTPVPASFRAPAGVLDDVKAFHDLSSATHIEVWLSGAKYLPVTYGKLLETRPYTWNPEPVGRVAGSRLTWGCLTPVPNTPAGFVSEKSRLSFANDFDYEMAFKTAIMRENEVIVRQTEKLLDSSHSIALVHLYPPTTLPRDMEMNTQRVGHYKAYVRLNKPDFTTNGDTNIKLDAGLQVSVQWSRTVSYQLGYPLMANGMPPTWSGTVVELEMEAARDADLVILLKKPKGLAAPAAAEPGDDIRNWHIHEALVKADLNETSAKRQFKAITTVAENPGSPIWPTLLNQQVVSLPFGPNTYNLLGVAEHYIGRTMARELAKEMKKRQDADIAIAVRIQEELNNAEIREGTTPVSTTSQMLDGLTIDTAPPTIDEWDPAAPELPNLPEGLINFWGKSSREMQREEDDRVAAFIDSQEVWRQEAREVATTGNQKALQLARSLNEKQLLAFNSSCRYNPGFTLLTGPPGTGKSYLIKCLVAAYAAVGLKSLVTAPSNFAVNVLAMSLFEGSKGAALSFHARNSLGLSYDDIVRVYPEKEESNSAKFPSTDYQSDEVLLHLMRAENADSSNATMSQLSLAGHIHRLAQSTRQLPGPGDPWKDYRLHIAGQPCKRSFSTCYKEIARAVLRRAKIVLSTLNTSQISIIRHNFLPSLVVVDEAAQACEPDSLIPFAANYEDVYCRFLAGDERQLPPTVLGVGKSEQAEQLALPLFSRLKATGTPTCLLVEQYRMTQAISNLPNRVMYNGSLLNHFSTGHQHRPVARDFLQWTLEVGAPNSNRIFYNVVQSQCSIDKATHSQYNMPHLAAIANLLELLLMKSSIQFDPGCVNILCFYKAQRSRLLEYLRLRSIQEQNPIWSTVQVYTVDSYQGKERDVIILDLVVTGGSDLSEVGFVRKDARLNVALTRARNGLLVVGYVDGIISLKGVTNTCLLLQLGRDVIERSHIWNTNVTRRDWHRIMDQVEPSQSGPSQSKRSYSALTRSAQSTASVMDPWELEEFRTGMYNHARDVDRSNEAPDASMTGTSGWRGLGGEPETRPSRSPSTFSPTSKRSKRDLPGSSCEVSTLTNMPITRHSSAAPATLASAFSPLQAPLLTGLPPRPNFGTPFPPSLPESNSRQAYSSRHATSWWSSTISQPATQDGSTSETFHAPGTTRPPHSGSSGPSSHAAPTPTSPPSS